MRTIIGRQPERHLRAGRRVPPMAGENEALELHDGLGDDE